MYIYYIEYLYPRCLDVPTIISYIICNYICTELTGEQSTGILLVEGL